MIACDMKPLSRAFISPFGPKYFYDSGEASHLLVANTGPDRLAQVELKVAYARLLSLYRSRILVRRQRGGNHLAQFFQTWIVDGVVYPAPVALASDKAKVAQNAEVLRDGRLADSQTMCQAGDTDSLVTRAAFEDLQQGKSRWIT